MFLLQQMTCLYVSSMVGTYESLKESRCACEGIGEVERREALSVKNVRFMQVIDSSLRQSPVFQDIEKERGPRQKSLFRVSSCLPTLSTSSHFDSLPLTKRRTRELFPTPAAPKTTTR